MIRLDTFKEQDIIVLTPIMKRAFDDDSMIHLNRLGGPEGYDDGSFLRKWGFDKGVSAYTIYNDKIIIGCTFLWIKKDHNNFLGCIFIDPEYQNKGLGLKVWQMIEKMYPDTLVWRTETPIFSHRNHNFYINKCKFHLVYIENAKDYEEGMYKLEKKMSSR